MSRSVTKSVSRCVHRPTNVPAALSGPAFSPTQVSGLQLWLDARTLSLSNNAAVSSWANSSGAASAAAQATGSKQPLYIAASTKLNGKPAVRFDGTDDALNVTGLSADIANSTVIMAFAAPVQGGEKTPFSMGGTAFWMRQEGSNARLNAFQGGHKDTGVFLGTDTPELYTFRSGGGAFVVRANGLQSNLLAPSTATLTTMSLAELAGFPGTFNWSGDIAQLLVYSPSPTIADIAKIEQYLRDAGYGISAAVSARPRVVCCCGDSITRGISLANNVNYPAQLKTLLGANWDVYNFGISGAGIDNAGAGLGFPSATMLSPKLINDSSAVAVVFGGTNNLRQGQTDSQTYSQLSTYCLNLRNAGFKVVVCTILPRSEAGTPVGFETARQSVNTQVRANWSTFANAIADVAANTLIGDAGDETNTTYYLDLVHLTQTGCGVVAGIVQSAINTL